MKLNLTPKQFGRPVSRFWANVQKTNGCWEWTGGKHAPGYGRLFVATKEMRAHRFSWLIHNGRIPDGLFVCHKCDNPNCVNPEHLFLGTHQDNMDDMVAKGRVVSACGRKTHCLNGHKFTVENTYDDKRGKRGCRACRKSACERYAARKRGLTVTTLPQQGEL